MRIAFNGLLINKNKTGIGFYSYHLIKNLLNIDSRNEYFLYLNNQYDEDQFIRDNLKIIKVDVKTARKRILYEQVFLPVSLIKNKIDVFHSPSFALPLFCPAKSIVTVHDLVFILMPETIIRTKRIYYKIMKLSIKKSKMIIAISENTKRDLIEKFNISPNIIKVIYMGIDQSAFNAKNPKLIEDSSDWMRIKYNLNSSYILYVGTIEPRKNLIRLVKAFYKLKRNYKTECKLVIVGKKGWLYKNLFSKIEELNMSKDVIFTGYVKDIDLPLFYRSADLFIYASLYEGFGLPILEAMACGTPIVSSNAGSLVEVLGQAALVFNPLDVNDMADKMHQVISDEGLRKELREKGLKRVREFSWKKCAAETLRFYEEVYNAKNKGFSGQ